VRPLTKQYFRYWIWLRSRPSILKDKGYDVWGLDRAIKFIEYAKNCFPEISSHFRQASLPFKNNPFTPIKFDAIISIAVWMHLYRKDYKDAVQSIVSTSSPTAVIIISYSIGSRAQTDERYFETVDLEYLTKLFSNENFRLIETTNNQDSLKRDSLTWITVVFKRD